MQTTNIKVYLVVSGVFIILFLFVTFYPIGKKQINNNQFPKDSLPTPTSVEHKQISNVNNNIPTIKVADSTGVYEEELPTEVINLAKQKQDLRQKTPYDTGLFQIDFDYGEDKFIVTLNDPKEENRFQFDQWLKNNYPKLNINQFNFK